VLDADFIPVSGPGLVLFFQSSCGSATPLVRTTPRAPKIIDVVKGKLSANPY
jgi:hypothetical protein